MITKLAFYLSNRIIKTYLAMFGLLLSVGIFCSCNKRSDSKFRASNQSYVVKDVQSVSEELIKVRDSDTNADQNIDKLMKEPLLEAYAYFEKTAPADGIEIDGVNIPDVKEKLQDRRSEIELLADQYPTTGDLLAEAQLDPYSVTSGELHEAISRVLENFSAAEASGETMELVQVVAGIEAGVIGVEWLAGILTRVGSASTAAAKASVEIAGAAGVAQCSAEALFGKSCISLPAGLAAANSQHGTPPAHEAKNDTSATE